MKKFVIERNLPGAGNLSAQEVQAIAQASCRAIDDVGGAYQWVQSYVTGDKIYCVHIAESAEAVHEHARLGGFPVDVVNEVVTIMDPMNAE